MKKEFKKIICCMILMMLFSTIYVNVAAINEKVGFDTLEESLKNEFGDNYEEFLKNNAYEVKVAKKIEEKFKENYGEKYPSYYGGMYITDDSKNLVVQIVKNNVPSKEINEYKVYENIINLDKTILIEFVENSFNDLITTQEMINDNLTKSDNFSGMSIDVINNIISVKLINNSLEKQKEFELSSLRANSCVKGRKDYNEYLDFKLVKFKQGGKNETTALTTLKAGDGISTFGGNSCSIAFRTKYNGVKGYVTAGHCVRLDGLDTVLKTGSVKVYQFKNNEKYDYAFVATNANYDVSNQIGNTLPVELITLLVSNSTPAIPVGTAISKSGQSSKITSGRITGLNKTVPYENVGNTVKIIKGLVESDLYCTKGDSGGVIYTLNGFSTAFPIGILSGKNNDEGLTYFTSIDSLPFALQNGRY